MSCLLWLGTVALREREDASLGRVHLLELEARSRRDRLPLRAIDDLRFNLFDCSVATRAASRRRHIKALFACLLLISGCSSLPFSNDAIPHCPVALVPSQELDPGLRMQLRFHVTTPETSLRVETSLEVQDGKLVVAGFTPFGTRAFTITQSGSEIEVVEQFGRNEGVRPVLILDALHRALLLPSGSETPRQWGGEWVEEQRTDQRLVRRVFRALAPVPEGANEHTRDAGEPGARVEYRVLENVEGAEIENFWCPYEARMVILASNRPAAAAGAP